MSEIANILKDLGIGLSRLIRYSYGGFLLLLFAARLAPCEVRSIFSSLGPIAGTLCFLVAGVCWYVLHRNLIIPIHHFGLCFLYWSVDHVCFRPLLKQRIKRFVSLLRRYRFIKRMVRRIWCCMCFSSCLKRKTPENSLSPTYYLAQRVKVPCPLRMAAYSHLRRVGFFPRKDALDVAHAENGMLVMTAEGLAAAGFYIRLAKGCCGEASVYLCLAGIFLIGSYAGALAQHSVECLYLKRPENLWRIRGVLKDAGFL